MLITAAQYAGCGIARFARIANQCRWIGGKTAGAAMYVLAMNSDLMGGLNAMPPGSGEGHSISSCPLLIGSRVSDFFPEGLAARKAISLL